MAAAHAPVDGQTLLGCATAPAEAYDLALLDLDGVVYIGRRPVPGAAEALERARAAGMRIAFVTNNASRTPQAVADQLTSLGVKAGADDVVTSAQAAAAVLAARLPAGSRVLVVGGEGLNWALQQEGLRPVSSMDDEPAAVVQGFSPDLGWRMLAEGSRAVRAGLPWLATNTDLTVPTAYGPAPGNGTLVAAIAAATGVRPDVAGKPRPPLFEQAVRRYRSRTPLVVGDRLDTDIEGAHAAGLVGMLVLTGVSGAADVITATAEHRPHLLARDLGGLLTPHPAPRRSDTGWACGEAEVGVEDGRLRVVRPGEDAVDLLRAACATAWATGGDAAPAPDDVIAELARLEGGGGWAR
jgi:HAD superfamily hydrolase (TIGR01450 family)